jgi:predicted metal-binding membrane protein
LRVAIVAITLAAWCALWLWGGSSYGHILLHGATHLSVTSSSVASFALLFIGGWTLMTLAMMLPTSLPLVLMFRRMVASRQTANPLVALLIIAYLAIWAACGVVLFLLNSLLHLGITTLPWLSARPAIATAIILAIAGAYQFSPLKYACLDKCRSPMAFLAARWRGGNEPMQAVRIGAEHGLYCVGCCWSLMLLMFLVSAGSLLWMMFLGIVMAMEKNLSFGRRLSAPVGVLLMIGAASFLVIAVRA